MAIVYPHSMQSNAISEMWRMTSSFTGSVNPITNWEKADDVGSYSPYHESTNNNLLFYSNGIFTFREKGGYLIQHYCMCYHSQQSYYNVMGMELSWNNGANWDAHSQAYASFPNANSGYSNTHELTGTAMTFVSIPADYDTGGSGTRKIKFSKRKFSEIWG